MDKKSHSLRKELSVYAYQMEVLATSTLIHNAYLQDEAVQEIWVRCKTASF